MSLLRPNGLARTSVRFRPASFAGSFVALLFAAMLVTMCGVFMESGIRAHATPERYADTPVLVSGPNDVSKRLGKGRARTPSRPRCPSGPGSTPGSPGGSRPCRGWAR